MGGNPIKANQVFFTQRGRRRMGWIGRSTPTRYRIDYKKRSGQKGYSHVWRSRQDVEFVATGKKGRTARANVSRATVKRAVSLSQRFHGLRPRRLSRVKITWPRALVLLGHAVRIDYLSDKEDGKPRIYTHDFDRPAQVFASGSAKGGQKNMLLLHGRFNITEEGIVG